MAAASHGRWLLLLLLALQGFALANGVRHVKMGFLATRCERESVNVLCVCVCVCV